MAREAREAREGLSRRERQIMDILYREGQATAAQVRKELPDPPGYSAVRALLRILEQKGHVGHVAGPNRCYVFRPLHARETAARSALKQTVRTFFDNSAEKAMVALLDVSEVRLPPEVLLNLVKLIEQAKKEGR